MRLFVFFISLLIALTSHSQWTPYPDELERFDYSGDKLQEYWPQLAAATNLPWPDETYIKNMMRELPQLADQLHQLAQQENAHSALKATLNKDYQSLALAVQHVWRLHFQGQYQQAYELGLTLGPAGLFPAIYAKLIHTTYLINDTELKQQKFIEVDQIISDILPLANNFSFILFGDAYQKARRLELMSTTAATASGLLGPTQDSLKQLHQEDPNNPLYSAMLSGIDAGIIQRVGTFVGGMTYGADDDRAIELFTQALKKEKRLAVLYHEFAQVLIRLDDSDHDQKLDQALQACIELSVFSAEEALNQQGCKRLLTQRLAQNDD